jgi:hypothetical protein
MKGSMKRDKIPLLNSVILPKGFINDENITSLNSHEILYSWRQNDA